MTVCSYTLKNRLWLVIALLYCVTGLVGCASGPYVSVSSYAMDARYVRMCVGPDAPFRPTDRECRQMWEPHTQSGQVKRVTPPSEMEPWQRDIEERKRCRATGAGCPAGLK